MTISTSSSQVTVAANGSNKAFNFPFVGVSSADITVSSVASNGTITAYSPSLYAITFSTAAANQLWGVGGTCTFNSAPASGTSVLIQRSIPYTQQISVQNQGNYYAQVTEQALDILCMELQQQVGRTTQFRGIWQTGTAYTIGDIVQDGANGADTLNYYICTVANTSGTWSTDLANGDWSLSVLAAVPTTNQMITLSGAISGSGTTSIVTGINANQVTSSSIISGGVTLPKLASIGPNTVLCNPSASSGTPGTVFLSSGTLLGVSGAGNVAPITLGNSLSMQSNTLAVITANTYQASPGDPSATTNGTGVMLGLAGAITTNSTGSIMITISGVLQNTNAGTTDTMQIRYGTGAAPGNGTALTGTAAGPSLAQILQNNGVPTAFSRQAIVTGLGIGSVYWIDSSLSTSAGSAQMKGVSLSVYEIK